MFLAGQAKGEESMKPTEVRQKLQQACDFAGHDLADVPTDDRQWIISLGRNPNEPVTVNLRPPLGVVTFEWVIRLPEPPDVTDLGEAGMDSYRRMVLETAPSVDPLIQGEFGVTQRDLVLTLRLYLDGFTVHQVARGLAALERTRSQVAGAVEGFRTVTTQAQQLAQAVEEMDWGSAAWEELTADLDELERELRRELPEESAPPTGPLAPGRGGWEQGRPEEGRPAWQPTKVTCPNCGYQSEPGKRFCAQCGVPLS